VPDRFVDVSAGPGRVSAVDAVFFLTMIYLVIDSVNGYLLRQDLFSISMPYKILLLLLIILTLRLYLLALGIMLGLFFFLVARVVMSSDVYTATAGLDMLAKFASIPVFYVFFRRLLQRERSPRPVYLLARACFLVLAINIVMGSLGFGYTAYSGSGLSIGSKGFIFAGNELGLALFLSGALVLLDLLVRERYKSYVAVSLLWVALSILSAVKVAAGTALMLSLLFPVIRFYASIRGWLVNRRLFGLTLLVLTMGPFVAFGAVSYLLFQVGLWERISFFLARVDWITVMMSERNIRAEAALAHFANNYSVPEQLLGRGLDWMVLSGTAIDVEMDPIDFLMRYGLIGALIPYMFFLSVLYAGIALNRQMPIWREIAVVIILILVISVLAGHVLSSGTAAPLIGAVLAVALAHPTEFCRRGLIRGVPAGSLGRIP
jgi:hypothetical protein